MLMRWEGHCDLLLQWVAMSESRRPTLLHSVRSGGRKTWSQEATFDHWWDNEDWQRLELPEGRLQWDPNPGWLKVLSSGTTHQILRAWDADSIVHRLSECLSSLHKQRLRRAEGSPKEDMSYFGGRRKCSRSRRYPKPNRKQGQVGWVQSNPQWLPVP